MKCPVCDKENTSMLCPECGFDSSRDYGRYPSFGIVGQVPAASALRKQRQEKQMPKENEDVAVSPHIEPEQEKPGESEKVDISDKVRKWEIPSWLITTAFAVTLVLGVLIGSVLGGGKPMPSEPGESVQMQQPPETTKSSSFEPDELLKLSDNIVTLVGKESAILRASLDGTVIDSSKIEWTTSDANVATVTNGIVVPVGKGSATITAEYKGRKATSVVNCRSVGVSHTDVTLNVGESFELEVTDDSGLPQLADWTMSNTGVVITKKEGFHTTVVGWAPGTVTLETKVKGMSYTCIVRCRSDNPDPNDEQDGQPAADWKVYPNDDVLIAINESFRLKVTNSAGETANAIWSMSTEGIVSIEGSKVTGLATGVVTLRTTIDGKKLSCIIRVR